MSISVTEVAQIELGSATRREWLGLAVIALPCMLYAMDLTVLNLALPTLSRELRPSGSELLWMIDIYGFMVAGFLVTMGNLGDRIGRRKLLMIGAAFFMVGSVLAAFARSAQMLIATRALLGIAGATVAPSTLSLIRNMFHDERERTTAIGIWIASYSVGGAIGPLVGGALLAHFWWGSVFLLAVPVMGLLLLCGPWLLPEYRDPRPGRIDLASALLSLSAVLSFIYGLKRVAEHGVSLVGVAAIAAGLTLGLVFLRRQRTLRDPMVDLALFRIPAFSASLLGYALGALAMMGVFIWLGQYMQLVLGLSPLRAGLWLAPSAVAFVVGSLVVPPLAQRVAAVPLISGGLVFSALSFVLLSQVVSAPMIAFGTVVMALGMSPLFTLANDIVVGSAPPERTGVAAGLSETSAELSAAIGIALFGSLGNALYRTTLVQAGVHTEQALGTLGGALEYAATLPAREGAALIDAANAGFLQALRTSAWVGAGITIVSAAVIARFMKR
jgi:MFS transporter, DHA2 family, multidrug resistance protein